MFTSRYYDLAVMAVRVPSDDDGAWDVFERCYERALRLGACAPAAPLRRFADALREGLKDFELIIPDHGSGPVSNVLFISMAMHDVTAVLPEIVERALRCGLTVVDLQNGRAFRSDVTAADEAAGLAQDETLACSG